MERAHTERLFTGYTGRLSLALAAGWFATRLGRNVLPPLLPTISEDLAISPATAGFVLTLMWGIYAALQYPAGRLSDQWSRTTVLTVSLAVMVAGYLLLSAVTTFPVLLAGVTLVGVGGGLYFVPTRAFLSDLFVERRGQALGLQQASGAVGSAAAGGLVVVALTYATWQSAFLPVAALMAVSLVALARWSAERYVVSRVNLEVRGTAARVFRTSEIRWIVVAYSAYVFTWQAVVGFLPTFLQAQKDFSPALASLSFSSLFVVAVVAGPGAGRLGDRIAHSTVATGALAASVVGLAAVVLAPSLPGVVAGIVALALGTRSFPPVMQAYLLSLFPDESMGGDFGALKTVYTGVGSLGPAYVGLVAQRFDYAVAFGGLVPCLVLAGAIILWLAVLS